MPHVWKSSWCLMTMRKIWRESGQDQYLNSWGKLAFLHGMIPMASTPLTCALVRRWPPHPGREDSCSRIASPCLASSLVQVCFPQEELPKPRRIGLCADRGSEERREVVMDAFLHPDHHEDEELQQNGKNTRLWVRRPQFWFLLCYKPALWSCADHFPCMSKLIANVYFNSTIQANVVRMGGVISCLCLWAQLPPALAVDSWSEGSFQLTVLHFLH